MRFFRGTTRIAVEVGGVVFKFPDVTWLWVSGKYILTNLLKGNFVVAKETVSYNYFMFLRGFFANLSEHACWLYCRAPFLVPVIGFGLVNIQRYEEGEHPTDEELHQRWERLPETVKRDIHRIDGHNRDRHNWKKNAKGLRLFDYGDRWGETGIPLSSVLIPYHRKLAKVLCSTSPPSDHE